MYQATGFSFLPQVQKRQEATSKDFIKMVHLFKEAQAKEHGTYPVADPERHVIDPKITPKEADLIVKGFEVFGQELADVVDPTKLSDPTGPLRDLQGFRFSIEKIKEIIALRDIKHHYEDATFGRGWGSSDDPDFVDTVETLAFSKSFEELAKQRYQNKYMFVPTAGMLYGDLMRFARDLNSYAWAEKNIDGAWERMIKSVGESTLEVPSTIKDWAGKGWDGAGRFVGAAAGAMSLAAKATRWAIYGAIGYGAWYVYRNYIR